MAEKTGKTTSKKKNGSKIYEPITTYPDRRAMEDNFKEIDVKIETIDTLLLLIDTQEETVLINTFTHLINFYRRETSNLNKIKDKKLVEILLEKQFFKNFEGAVVRRFATLIPAEIVNKTDYLTITGPAMRITLLNLCMEYYTSEEDYFCTEYLAVIINRCLDDPQVVKHVLANNEFLEKFYIVTAVGENPDQTLHAYQIIHKLLQAQNTESTNAFINDDNFPWEKIICDLINQYAEIRSAALKIMKLIVYDTTDTSPFSRGNRSVNTVQNLSLLLCSSSMSENRIEVIETLAAALRTERMTKIFFEQGEFDKIKQCMERKEEDFPIPMICKVLNIFAEAAKYQQFLRRIHEGHFTEKFLKCILEGEPAPHILLGLNRLLKDAEAKEQIIEMNELGLISKILLLIQNRNVNVKLREQAAELLNSLLTSAFHLTADSLISKSIISILSGIFNEDLANLSIDFLKQLLLLIENLAQNDHYRSLFDLSTDLPASLGTLLKNSFSSSLLVTNIFRCLCTIVDEPNFRETLLENFLIASIKRGLNSIANLVKTAVTNFILQTTRYPECVEEYIQHGVLEILLLRYKHGFCVSTWGPAIESILSKSCSLKFAVRNQLDFTDNTVGQDFFVSTKKYQDFRIFQSFFKHECSPLYPVLCVNFERPNALIEDTVEIPIESFGPLENANWTYCRKPGDPNLPLYLEELQEKLEEEGLMEHMKAMTCKAQPIDFANMAKRVKVIAQVVAEKLSIDLKILDLISGEECSRHLVKCHLNDLRKQLHCSFIPLGMVQTGCQFERAILFKAFADQIGLPATLQRSVDGLILFNEVPLPLELEQDEHCDPATMEYMSWRLLRPTHVVDLMFNVGDLYPLQSRQALQYLRYV